MNRFLELLAAGTPMSAAIVIATKATLLLVLAFVVATLLRRRSAAIRHLVWTASLGGIVALALPWPGVAPVPVALHTLGTPSSMQGIPASLPNDEFSSYAAKPSVSTAPAPPPDGPTLPRRSLESALLLLWITGVIAVLAWAVLGRIGLTAITRRAEPMDSDEWKRLLQRAATDLDVTRLPALRRSRNVTTPLVWGALKPVVLLPWNADGWPLDRKRVVLMHELAHVARRDALAQLVSVAACALYWAHPLAWMAARKQRLERERACDDAVLVRGTPGHVYATELLELARGASVPRFAGMFAAGMARPTELEGRLVAALEQRARRRRVSMRLTIGAVGAMLLVALPLAVLRPELRAAVTQVAGLNEVTRTVEQHEVAPATSEIAAASAPGGSVPRLTSDPRLDSIGAKTSGTEVLGVVEPAALSISPVTVMSVADTIAEYSAEAKAGERLTIDLETGGTVIVRPGDDNRVTVRAELGGRNWPETRVAVERVTDGVRLRTTFVGRLNNRSTSHRFSVRVPKRFDVRMSSAGGGLDVAGIEGTIRGHTGGGSLRFERMRGRLAITTGGGDVRVLNSDLNGHVSTGGGLVIVSRVTGDLDAQSGSGPIIRGEVNEPDDTTAGRRESTTTTITDDDFPRGKKRDVDPDDEMERAAAAGAVSIEKAGGGIRIPSAPHGATLQTGGGDIDVGRVVGDIDASTGGGDIEIGPVSGSARASTGAGKVSISLEGGGRDREVRVFTGFGRVTIEMPSNFDAALDLETAYTREDKPTRIISDWSLPTPATTDWDDSEGTARRYVRIRATIGSGGNRIRVKAVNGDVVLRRR